MGMPTYSELVEVLRERELELFATRRNFDELSNKFSQLENAFAVNLHIHVALERKLEIYKLRENPDEKEVTSFDNTMDRCTNAEKQFYTSLNRVQTEKERWKQAYLHEKKVVERQKLKHNKSIKTIRAECENILKNCRASGEKHFRELSTIYDDARKQIRIAEDTSRASKARESLMTDRVLRLANLLETLKKVEGVRVDLLCEHASETLRTLANGDEDLYEERMRKLPQVTSDISGNDENRSLEFLQAQNSVLREIVRSLKRRLKENLNGIAGTEEFSRNAERKNSSDESCGTPRNEESEKCEGSMKNESEILNPPLLSPHQENEIISKDMGKPTIVKIPEENSENCRIRNNSSHRIARNIYVETFESHQNGIRFDEYTFKFLNQRQLRVRHSSDVEKEKPTLIIEFVDSEKKFREAPVERTVFYLGENVRQIVNFEKSVMHCGVQTKRTGLVEKIVQTRITGSNGFFRINAGTEVLNSQKRAIERSVGKLENTVARLKERALSEARSMIGYDVNRLGNQFFDSLQRLEC